MTKSDGTITDSTNKSAVRKVWQTGRGARKGKGSYVTALLSSWASKIPEKKVTMLEYGKGLFLLPYKVESAKRGRYVFDGQDANSVKYQIISAYLNNYQEYCIELENPSKECFDMLAQLPSKLDGLNVHPLGGLKMQIKMNKEPSRIPEILGRMLESIKFMHEINQKTFIDLYKNSVKSSEADLENIKLEENAVDRDSFLIKRFCHLAAEQPEHAKEVGISDITEIRYWDTLNSNLERVGDMQFEIYDQIDRLKRNHKIDCLDAIRQLSYNAFSFRKYHDQAQKMVNDACSKDPEIITKIISTKRTDNAADDVPRHRGEYITQEDAKFITQILERNPELHCLDVRIWAITRRATNIAENWLNMNGPKINKEEAKPDSKQRPLISKRSSQ
jgi:hypothetical protein